MPIIYQYLVKEVTKFFGIILATVVVIYLAVDFFEKIDDFIEAGLPTTKAFYYFFLKIPFIIAQIMPVGTLLSVLLVFGLMSRNNEMMALKASGISIHYLLAPILTTSILFALSLFLISEEIIPITMDKANRIWRIEVRKESAVSSREKNIWIKSNRMISHIKYYNPAQKAIYGVTLNHFDTAFKLIRRIDAERGTFQGGTWTLFMVMEQSLEKETGRYQVSSMDQKTETLPFYPEDLQRAVKKSEEMSFSELYQFAKKVEDEGYDATLYRVDLHTKIAFPFVCIVMCLAGAGIALKRTVRDALPLGIAYGVGTAFLYWILYSFCVSLGYGEMLPPFIAAWTANFMFLCGGAFNLLKTDY
ncbi:MAG: LPS export ABC transporter permease LptG [Deltaproteobacteria bacterium RBG_13_49_15]|nr:MAG: LPS export ABC transporter permease LptG [Deltaproteobacteria bacterium RBG_13_49_15]